MRSQSRLAIVGSGASAIFVLKHIRDDVLRLKSQIDEIHIFEREPVLGTGMPYSPRTTDRYNLCNISSAEIPALGQSFVQWLATLDDATLAKHDIVREDIDAGETYSRLALGEYFHAQYEQIADALRLAGIDVIEHPNCQVDDIVDSPDSNVVTIKCASGAEVVVERVIVCTGHAFKDNDEPEAGYFASPWPMQKLLPKPGSAHQFTIGTLGASLSAYDVVASLSHRHGTFEEVGNRLVFHPNANARNFRIVLHSVNGWLPHLQYEQEEPFREIYRHATREQLLGLRDANGCLSLIDYYDEVCRPALATAFAKDNRTDIVAKLGEPTFTLNEFVQLMTSEHEYAEPLEGMRAEMPEAERSIRRGRPIHWKEVLDDLMFTLNFHFEWLYAEDVLTYRATVVPFLMNVIAAMPLKSAKTLLALYDAGHLELLPGRATIQQKTAGKTVIEVENDGQVSQHEYEMFVDCTGQGSIEIDQFPFPTLLNSGAVIEASAPLRDRKSIEAFDDRVTEKLLDIGGQSRLRLGGIAIDGYFRIIGENGQSNPRIFDIAFPHATGVRPYTYGLQACNTTASIVVQALTDELIGPMHPSSIPEAVTRVYDGLPTST